MMIGANRPEPFNGEPLQYFEHKGWHVRITESYDVQRLQPFLYALILTDSNDIADEDQKAFAMLGLLDPLDKEESRKLFLEKVMAKIEELGVHL